jgi:glycosyltransferase involved in cell wall biosynthesis
MDEKGRLKIVMVISHAQASVGGMQKQAFCLAHELQSRGLAVTVLSKRPTFFKAKGERNRESQAQKDHGGVKIVELPIIGLQPAWSFLFSILIWGCISRNTFQIIHAHNTALGVISSIVGWLLGKKVIIKIPGMKYVHYLSGGSLSRGLRRWILTRKTDRFVAVSTEMVQSLRELRIAPEKIVLIPNGIELTGGDSSHDCRALKINLLGNAEARVVLFVGRLVKEKGLERLLTVWGSLPDRDGRLLVIVGDGPLRADLESRASPLASSVRFLGHRADVSKFYAIADIFVLPSKTEGVSNSLLEAMCAGIPVVASNVGGNKDVLEDGRSGYLVDWEDVPACVQVLSTLLSDPDLREYLGEAAKRRVRNFAMGNVAQGYVRLYETVLQE